MNKSLLKGLLIISLIFIFSSSSNAQCKKDEIIKLITAGYNKNEIADLCGGNKESQSNSKQTPGDSWTDPMNGIEFVFVPGGCFNMGSNSGDKDEMPVHEVCVDEFWMGKYEVTQGQWKNIMGENPSNYKSGDNWPVERVTWFAVKKFVSLLSEQSDRNFSLPSEAQWEYAARSGGKDKKMLGKNDIDQTAWYKGNSGGTRRVGSKVPNGFGIYDMKGNVWEWCEDKYHKNAYSMHSLNNPIIETSSGPSRVKRGGAYSSDQSYLKPTNRSYQSAPFGRFDLGFRICLPQIQ